VVDPLFWLGLSILLVAASLTAVLVAALPAFRELARAARSAEKLFDTLSRELPPTLEAIRLTGMEITDLTEDVSDGVQSAGRVVQQVDQSVSGARKQAKQVQTQTRSLLAGVKAAWGSFNRPAVSIRHSDRYAELRSSTPLQIGDDYPELDGEETYEELDKTRISHNPVSQNSDSQNSPNSVSKRPAADFEAPDSSDRPNLNRVFKQKP
jgi:FtsZ-binding cell division protein ZapB